MHMVSCSIRDMCVRVSRSMSQKSNLRNPRCRIAKCLSCAVAASGTESSISSPSSRGIRTIERKETEDAARRMKWDGTPMKWVARWSSRRDGSETTVWIALLNPYGSLFQYTALLAENMRRSTFFYCAENGLQGGVIELPIRRTQSNGQVVDVRPEVRELGKSGSGIVECGV
ncbi:hypothetical protein C8J57DRAFT_1339858, partial [Mycena rebaudengoi]